MIVDRCVAARVLAGLLALPAAAQDAPPPAGWRPPPPIQPASDDWRAAAAGFRVADGLAVSLFAAEPLVVHPVCLAVADDGAVIVGETFRHHAGVTDIREHWDWLEDDLQARTVEDRLAYLRVHAGDGFEAYAQEEDRVRRLRDLDGDGRADEARILADGFREHGAGIGAGLLPVGPDLYYACIPHLWRLRDADGDGRAEDRQALSSGYGVHTGLLGHDLHGLRMGPDRRLYFSIGDRGLHVTTAQGVVDHAHTGCVLRCEPDGSGLEVFHTGLRNPQDLVFNAWGDLFTGDNNSDGGDAARWVHCLPGADSGWRFSYQWIEEPVSRGPWNRERLWALHHARQPGSVLPPVAHIANGPSGVAVDPGTGLTPEWREHFFLADFGGSATGSGVHAFTLQPHGAGFRMDPPRKLLWDLLATDVEFGPDGRLYVSDWVEGWNQTGKGRVWAVAPASPAADPAIIEVARLLASGVTHLELPDLVDLLSHADQRLRQAAHFVLADRGDDGIESLVEVAEDGDELLARVHGIWGLWVAGRREPERLRPLLALTRDAEAEVRTQALRVLGDLAWRPARSAVVAALSDPAPRARLAAALAAAQLGPPEAQAGLLAILRNDAAGDPALRHGAVAGLAACVDGSALVELAADPSPAVRQGAVLALRRVQSPLLSACLSRLERSREDEDLWIAAEIARAIHDLPVPTATAALAAVLDPSSTLRARVLAGPDLPADDLLRRAIAANLALGATHHARRVASLALDAAASAELRVDALTALSEWAAPSSRDRVTGAWRPLGVRPAEMLPALAATLAAGGLEQAPGAVRLAFLGLLARLDRAPHHALLAAWLMEAGAPSEVRARALELLASSGAPDLDGQLAAALVDADGVLRARALEVLGQRDAVAAAPFLPAILASGELAEQRAAYRILSAPGLDPSLRDGHLEAELGRLEAGLLSPEIHLDLVLAAEAAGLGTRLAARSAPAAQADPLLAPWLDTLFGGDAEAGREISARADLGCQRCHAPAEGAPRVGPPLAGIGRRQGRLALLAAIVDPQRALTPGYEATHLFLADGQVRSGRILREDAAGLLLLDAEGALHEISAGDVSERRPGLSAMPEGLAAALDRREMRDLLGWLAEQ